MRKETEIRERLAICERLAKEESDKKGIPYRLPDVEDPLLRGEIYTLLWVLDLIG